MKGTAYLLQATLILLWWIGMLLNQDFYDAFQFSDISKTAFNSFFLPDLLIISILSIIRAYNEKKELGLIILGGFAYASLYCINATILTKSGFLATTVMALGLAYNIFLVYEKQLFRKSNTTNILTNGIKTIIQIICVWTITLLIFPIIILKSFGEIPTITTTNKLIGISLLFLFSIIGIYSAISMVINGKGTPLPLDQTQQLVSKGLYKYVRNPMAIAGIGQGISISIIFGSISIFVYIIIGAILWQFVVRPIEEKDMEMRFGKEYDLYKENVKCWIPNFKQKD
jgi:protein-S-isoprenylcysteine O-methyltransferase Ste14